MAGAKKKKVIGVQETMKPGLCFEIYSISSFITV